MRTVGVILARSGSKGIKNKNIRLLNGKPLIAYTIESALGSHYVDEVMVSTNSYEYAEISKKYGANVPFLRNEINATDTAKSLDVLFEVLDEYEKMKIYFDNIVMLQPTSPLRTSENIDEAFRIFYERDADSVVSVCECEHSPLLSNTLPKDLSLSGFVKKENITRRQDLQNYYRLNGAIYISKVDVLRKERSFYGKKSYAYIMNQRQSVDIDTELDLQYVEFLMQSCSGMED